MAILYIDNIRGFSNTYLELKQINFFVGENSTGKTSILKILRAISDTRFWFSGVFGNEKSELGYFNEIITKGSTKKYFEIGFLGEEDKNVTATKIKFINENGQPIINEIRTANGKFDIHAIRYKDDIKYRYKVYSEDIFTVNSDLKKAFQSWIGVNSLKNKSYKISKFEESVFKGAMLFQVQASIDHEIRKNGKDAGINISLPFPSVLGNIVWMAPIRTEPKRTYDSYKTTFNPDGTHAPYVLKELLSGRKGSKSRDRVETILKKFGADSGLYDQIEINQLGNSSTSPFEIHVSLNGKPLKITNVGYGVSQILPLIIQIISTKNKVWFALQQPEIHLHPRAQAAFGDFLYKSSSESNSNFIIETHSDFTINRFRLKKMKQKGKKVTAQIIFFKRTKKGNSLNAIKINDDGSYDENQPKEFRKFFIREQLELINL